MILPRDQKSKFKSLSTLTFVLMLSTFQFSVFTFPAYGQGIEVTNVYDIADKEVVDGDLIISTSEGFIRANRPFDVRLFGVIQSNPIAVARRADNSGTPIVRGGTALVNVTTTNGPIKKGDFLTSSELPGKAQRSNVSGYALGVALKDFDGSEGEKVPFKETEVVTGKIPAAIKIEYVELTGSRSLGRTFDYFNNAFFSNVQDPERFTQIIRYIMAGMAVLISFAVAFFTFSRSLPKAMEAIGRNPLAANTIRISIVLNIVFTIGVGLVGVIAAIIIIKL